MAVLMPEPQNTQLGKSTVYRDRYDPGLLDPIPRSLGRNAIGDHDFRGVDIWRLYELSWLDARGLPQTAVGELLVPAASPFIVESKSLKLYAGSFAMTRMDGREAVQARMTEDLSACLQYPVVVRLYPVESYPGAVRPMPGTALESLVQGELSEQVYETDAGLLRFAPGNAVQEQCWYTTAFRSLCPVTGQPDLASVVIRYKGRAIEAASLLQYLVSYRCHRGFHEQCVEQIYHDLRTVFAPEVLEVYACFTRRGGIDINPFRSSLRDAPAEILRDIRQ